MIFGMHLPLPATSPNSAILIAAISGRSLAAAARRAGFRPLVADLFNDADTLALADRAVKLAGNLRGGIDDERIIEALADLARDDRPLAVIYGSGFERKSEMIDIIAGRFMLAGNSGKTVRLVKDPQGLAALCDELDIPHPEIRVDPPANPKGWLTKLAGGAGGSHVKRAKGYAGAEHYFQRFVAGKNISVLFVADRRKAHIVGFSRQWSSPSRHTPYRYGGAVRLRRFERSKTSKVEGWLTALTGRTGLAGLNSADFIEGDGGLHLIEINPRPGATLDIFDSDHTPLLREHLRAIMGADISVPEYSGSAASGIAYTAKAINVFPQIDWPALTADHQMSGTTLAAGDPVCTVFATAPSAAAAMRAVKDRIKELSINWRGDFP
jgi:predicted ATP-grasp superfamily ATP-dependent carboligase